MKCPREHSNYLRPRFYLRSFKVARALLFPVFALSCSSDPGTAITVAVAPPEAKVATCSSREFSATVTGTSNQSVTWSVDPAAGSIDAKGHYVSPLDASRSSVSVIATSVADPHASARAQVTLATAFPGAPVDASPADKKHTGGTYVGIYQHAIVARGSRAYALWTSEGNVYVARTDDAGATFKPPVKVNDKDPKDEAMGCGALAIDAANPDVVYAVYQFPGSTYTEDPNGQSVSTSGIALATSLDGGATFKNHVLNIGGVSGGPMGWNGVGSCPDVTSPGGDTVVVEEPGVYNGDGNPDMYVFSDAHRGAGFASGESLDGDYLANGHTMGLARAMFDGVPLGISQNGGESPRLFTDGAGKLCATYVGWKDANQQRSVFFQCSNDGGATFSPPAMVDASLAGGVPAVSTGAFARDGSMLIAELVRTAGASGGSVYVTISPKGGSLGAPNRVNSYALPGQTAAAAATDVDLRVDDQGIVWLSYGVEGFRVVVDKSCDGGKTWSGPVLVNGKTNGDVDYRTSSGLVTFDAGRVGVLSWGLVSNGLDPERLSLFPLFVR